jgi:hypothetical protein
VILSREHCGYAWAPYEDALQRLTFNTAKELLTKAHNFLEASRPIIEARPTPDVTE